MKKIALTLVCMTSLFISSCSDDLGEMPADERSQNLKYTSSVFFNLERAGDAYWYPVYPGMAEWDELHEKGLNAVRDALKVPDSKLKKMSDDGLLQTLLDHPYSMDIDAVNSTKLADIYAALKRSSVSHILDEMEKRQDMSAVLLRHLKAFTWDGMYYAEFGNAYGNSVFEYLFVFLHPDGKFYKSLTDEGKIELARILVGQHDAYKKAKKTAQTYAPICHLLGRIMTDFNDEEFIAFTKSEAAASYSFMDNVVSADGDIYVEYAKSFLNNLQ